MNILKNIKGQFLLEQVLPIIEKNKAGRKYMIVDYEHVYDNQIVTTAIIPTIGLIRKPVAVANDNGFIATGSMPEEELNLYIDAFGI
ncbi:MAG: hypothetical protein IPQ23_00045 [Cytophagaceae bacterium]|nr:hypothetical protein [Cytophagaceae bacterium]